MSDREPNHITKVDEPESLPVICPSCLTPNPIGQDFCRKCATPLTSHAEIDPIGQIYAQGDVFRKAIDHPHNSTALIGIWIICGPTAIGLTCMTLWGCYQAFREPLGNFRNASTVLLGLMFWGVGAILFNTMVFRVTRNYIRQKRKAAELHGVQD
jgi:hypothetical protein